MSALSEHKVAVSSYKEDKLTQVLASHNVFDYVSEFYKGNFY